MGKMIKDIPSLSNHVDALEIPTAFDFYRCFSCGTLFTREQEQAAFKAGKGACPCGSRKYRPGRPANRKEWWSRNIRSYVIKIFIAREVAQWCEKYFPPALPLLGKLV